jgi:iron(II)-dependent oxidoreductase
MNYNNASVDNISSALLDARSRTLALMEGLSEEQLMGEILPIINPLRWEIGHVAYFHETWVVRHLGQHLPVRKDADQLFDSISINHEDRWDLPLPNLSETFEYMNNVLELELELLRSIELNDNAKYFYLLTLFHEDMHNEAFIYTRQTLSYPAPNFIDVNNAKQDTSSVNHEDIFIPGGSFMLGSERMDGFIFDNEKWAHKVEIAPFKIAKYSVTNEQYLEFVEANGYINEKYWDAESWNWRTKQDLKHPMYWKKDADGKWYVRVFDRWKPLQLNHAVIHISWYEAQAFCKWAQRRLPTEAEWEFAAACNPNSVENGHHQKSYYPTGNKIEPSCMNLDCEHLGPVSVMAFPESESAFGCRQLLGNVWEWTASTFKPYPGFSPDWYTEYSRPLFGETKVLRGGAWTTRSRMIRNTYRNYYGPDRNDVFAGFRTCAIN